VAGIANRAGDVAAGVSSGSSSLLDSMTPSEVLRRITTALEQAGIAYMLTGSLAGSFHGAPRSTQDVDIVIEASSKQLRKFVESLPETEYYADLEAALEAHRRESLFNVIDVATGWKIDLIIRKSRPFSQAEFARRQSVDVQGLSVFVASAEDVILAKLEWSKRAQSQRQLEDVVDLLKFRGEKLDLGYLEKWISELDLNQQWSRAKGMTEIS
jgi:hypothetical protein